MVIRLYHSQVNEFRSKARQHILFTSVGNEADLLLTWMTVSVPQHLGGLEEEGWGDGEVKGFGDLEVHDQHERAYGQVRGVIPFSCAYVAADASTSGRTSA
jgi:hypothetical protein